MSFSDAWVWFLAGIAIFGVLAMYSSRRHRQAVDNAARSGTGDVRQLDEELGRGGLRLLWWAITIIFVLLFVASLVVK